MVKGFGGAEQRVRVVHLAVIDEAAVAWHRREGDGVGADTPPGSRQARCRVPTYAQRRLRCSSYWPGATSQRSVVKPCRSKSARVSRLYL